MLWYLAVVLLIMGLAYLMVAQSIRRDLKAIESVWIEIRLVLETRRRRIRQLLELLTYPALSNANAFQRCMVMLDTPIQQQRRVRLSFTTENTLVLAVQAIINQVHVERPGDLGTSAVGDLLDRIRKYDDDEIARLSIAYDNLARKFNDRFNHGLDSFILRMMREEQLTCQALNRVTHRIWAYEAYNN